MAKIKASRIANKELHKSNENLRRNLHQRDRRSTRERGLNLPLRYSFEPFSQAIIDELVPPHYITPKIASFTGREDSGNHLTAFNAQMAVRCTWVLLQVQPYNGSVGFPTVISPLSLSSQYCLGNNSLSTRSSLLSCITFSIKDRGRKSRWRTTWIDSGHLR